MKRPEKENQSVARQAAKEPQRKDWVWNCRLYFGVQFTDNTKGENAVSQKRELLLSAPHGCHGQFLVIQIRAGLNLSHWPWSLLFDMTISIGFLRAKYFGYQAFADKSSCTLVPTVSGEIKLSVLLSFFPNQDRRCEGKQWGNNLLPLKEKDTLCRISCKYHWYTPTSSHQLPVTQQVLLLPMEWVQHHSMKYQCGTWVCGTASAVPTLNKTGSNASTGLLVEPWLYARLLNMFLKKDLK